MRISKLTISNYRNIDGITITFHPECSYIIGENNLGKSNLLALLNTVCNGRAFLDDDFADPEKPIEVEISLKLRPSEQGFFEDNFSPEDPSSLVLLFCQRISEAYPNMLNAHSKESIQLKLIRKTNFLKFETTSVPSKMLRLDTQSSTGLLFREIIERFLAEVDSLAFLNEGNIDKLMAFINEYLSKIKSFRDFSIRATTSSDTTDMLTNIFFLSDGERKIEITGSGVQYMAMASINILCQIMELYKSKSTPFKERLYSNNKGEILPLVISIDEPEVHLHPYLQRSLISYYRRILKNKDPEFTELIKKCFNIEGLDGQLIIVTHSTDALVGDYHNLIRFFKKSNKNKVVSGYNPSIVLKPNYEKHLIMRFPEIKEAFYSHCCILVEGETEYGCIHSFADKMELPLDNYSICVINAQSCNSIRPLQRLLKEFYIPSIAIYDGDVKNDHTANPNEFYTDEPCYEIEIVKELYSHKETSMIRQIALDLDNRAESTELKEDFVKKPFEKMGIDVANYIPKKLSDVSDNDETEFCRMYSAWFIAHKGVLLGRIIGDKISKEHIPECYQNAIKKACEIAVNT